MARWTSPSGRMLRSVLLLLASAMLLMLVFRSVGFAGFANEVRSAHPLWLGWALLAYVAELGLRSLRWLLLVEGVRWRHWLAIWWVATGVNEFLPAGGGEAARMAVGWDAFRIPPARILAPTVVERTMDLVVLLVLAGGGLAVRFVPSLWLIVIPVSIATFVAGYIVVRPRALRAMAQRVAGTHGRPIRTRLGRFLTHVADQLDRFRARPRTLALVFVCSAGVWASDAAMLWSFVRALGVDLDYWLVTGMIGLGYLAGFVSFLPSGLGSRETTFRFLLIEAGATTTVAGVAPLTMRFVQSVLTLGAAAMASVYVFWLSATVKRLRSATGPAPTAPARGPPSP